MLWQDVCDNGSGEQPQIAKEGCRCLAAASMLHLPPVPQHLLNTKLLRSAADPLVSSVLTDTLECISDACCRTELLEHERMEFQRLLFRCFKAAARQKIFMTIKLELQSQGKRGCQTALAMIVNRGGEQRGSWSPVPLAHLPMHHLKCVFLLSSRND